VVGQGAGLPLPAIYRSTWNLSGGARGPWLRGIFAGDALGGAVFTGAFVWARFLPSCHGAENLFSFFGLGGNSLIVAARTRAGFSLEKLSFVQNQPCSGWFWAGGAMATPDFPGGRKISQGRGPL